MRGVWLGAIAAVALALLALSATSALARTTRPYTGVSFGPDGTGGSESFVSLQGIAVDQSTGDVYVYDAGEGNVYKFDAAGEPVGFTSTGTNAIEGIGGPIEQGTEQIAVAPTGSPGGTAGDIYVANNAIVKVYAPSGAELGELGEGETCGVAVDPAGHLFIGTFPETIREYVPKQNPPSNLDLAQTAHENIQLCNVAADGAGNVYGSYYLGQKIAKFEGIADPSPSLIEPGAPTVSTDPVSNELYADRGATVATYGSDGSLLATFGEGQISSSTGVAVNHSLDEAYVGDGSGKIKVFGHPAVAPDASTGEATLLTPYSARLIGSVNPLGPALDECFFEYGETSAYGEIVDCEAPDAAEIGSGTTSTSVHADTTGLTKLSTYHFRLVVGNENGKTEAVDNSFTTTSAAKTEPAAPVGTDTATLRGTVFPEGLPYSECKFEYTVSGRKGFEAEAPCNPPAAAIPPGAVSEAVSAPLTGLRINTAYRVRLVVVDANGPVFGNVVSFTTTGGPLISEVRASGADQGSATLEADIDPQGSSTSYIFEWGPTAAYGHSVPAVAATPLGSGTTPVHVTARIAGLDAASTYHYRVVANSDLGPAASPDQELETLDSCGLPLRRCFEMLSPSQAGPVEVPGGVETGTAELHYQAAVRSGALAYVSEPGSSESTKPSEVLSKALLGPSGWVSTQLSPALKTPVEVNGGQNLSSSYIAMNEELTCGVLASAQALTPGMGPRETLESGGVNLYRDNMNGNYTAITDLVPETLELSAGNEGVIGAFIVEQISQNCGTVVFATEYRYPGVPVPSNSSTPVYEWREGTLRNLGYVPGPGGKEVLVTARIAAGGTANGVSADGSRVFFSAERQVGNNAGEEHTTGVFVREDETTRDVSLSQTTIPDTGATYQYATRDGSRAFFTANAGLTEESNASGTDLYEYNLEDEKLTDLSVAPEAGAEAGVAGFVGASEDGSRVYFLARGQLVPGEGGTFTENQKDGTYSLYTERGGDIAYVAGVAQSQLTHLVVEKGQTSRVSSDGRFLLFESTLDVTGYENPSGVGEAYLYDSEASSEPVVCVSCRQDGEPSVSPRVNTRINTGIQANSFNPPRALVVIGGSPRVFFNSFDSLAPGAEEGGNNVYEWADGQIFLIAAESKSLQPTEDLRGVGEESSLFLGANQNGADLYFKTPEALSWEDTDSHASIYDARLGGGRPAPGASPAPCTPTEESSCSGPAVAAKPSPTPNTQNFFGPKNSKKKHHKKKHHKKKHHKKKKQHANRDRRAGK